MNDVNKQIVIHNHVMYLLQVKSDVSREKRAISHYRLCPCGKGGRDKAQPDGGLMLELTPARPYDRGLRALVLPQSAGPCFK